MNSIEGERGFIFNNYCQEGTLNKEYIRTYFTENNAKKIDGIRLQIEKWLQIGLLTTNDYIFLLASLIESADKVANVASIYEAFLKHIKKTAQKEMLFTPIETVVTHNKKYQVFNQDANELIKQIKGDILYLDPPYNSRKYDTNYHILETIALYDAPCIKGKTGIRVEENKKSKYCSKKEARNALEQLIHEARFKYIFLSYNNEGIVPLQEIEKIMKQYGEYTRVEKRYRRFRADKESNRKVGADSVTEFLHCLVKA